MSLHGRCTSPAQSQVISTLGIFPILLGLWLMSDSQPAAIVVGRALALGSGIVSCLGNVACYEALNHAKAATVIPLTALYPVVTVLLAVPLLKERIAYSVAGHRHCRSWRFISSTCRWHWRSQRGELRMASPTSWILLPLAAIVCCGASRA